MRTLGILFLFISLISCSTSPPPNSAQNIELKSHILGTLSKDTSKVTKIIHTKKLRYNLIYIDTRTPEYHTDSILSSYKSAKAFGEKISEGLLFIGDLERKNMYEFQKLSIFYHKEYIKNKYSYRDGPFIIGIKDDKENFTINLNNMSPRCIDMLFQDISYAIDLKNLHGKVPKKFGIYTCSVIEFFKDIVLFVKNA